MNLSSTNPVRSTLGCSRSIPKSSWNNHTDGLAHNYMTKVVETSWQHVVYNQEQDAVALCMPNQHITWNVCLLTLLCFNNLIHGIECMSVELAVPQQSHTWSGMCICWRGCASTIPCMKWNVYLLTWLCFNNPMQEVECASVDLAVLQQSHARSGRCICWHGCASTIPHMKWKVYLLTWLCLNNPTHEVEGVSVELAVHQQSHTWSGRCICWLGCASTIPRMKWKVYLLTWLCLNNPTHEVEGVSVELAVHQQSHTWSGRCICWLGCASTIPHMKWKVYLLTWLCINNPMHEVECVSVDLAVLQQSHARSGMCICWLGCASTIPCKKWNVYLLTWLCFNNPMQEVECVSVDLAVLQQSNTWSDFNNPMHEVECVSVDLAVLQQSNTWSDFNNPMHEVECVSVDLAVLQQSNTWSDFNNPMHEVECVSVDLAVLQ